jgi:hypothetical protein
MKLTDRERGLLRVFLETQRLHDRWLGLLIFAVGLLSGVMGAVFGLQSILLIYGCVAIVTVASVAFAIIRRRMFSGNHHA